MSARTGFAASDAERQTADSASNYLCRSLRLLAERFGLEKSLANDPAAFAVQFAPLVSALIEAQAREYQSWVFYDRLESLDESLSVELARLANRWDDMNEEARQNRPHDPMATYRQARRAAREAAGDGE